MSSTHPAPGLCQCLLCHSWRRVGGLLARPNTTEGFRAVALRRIRELYSELLDAAEAFDGWSGGALAEAPPLAPGVWVGDQALPKVPPPTVAPGSEAPPAVGVAAEAPADPPVPSTGPAQATSKAGPAQAPAPRNPPEGEIGTPSGSIPLKEEKIGSEDKSPKKKKKKDKSHKKPKDKTKKKAEERPRTPVSEADYDRSSPTSTVKSKDQGASRKATSRERERERKAQPVPPVREASARRAERRERRSRSCRHRSRSGRKRPSRTPVRSRERGSRRRDSRRRGRSQEGAVASHSSRFGHLQPPEPLGPPRSVAQPWLQPPPGTFFHPQRWKPYRPWGGSSKGVKRRERAEDIRSFGTDPSRKAERERRQQG